MGGLPDPDWYIDNVLIHAQPGRGGRIDVGPAQLWQYWWSQQARDDDPAVVLARRQGFVVAPAQLRSIGWERHDLRRETRRGTWWSVCRGALSPVCPDDADPHVVRRRRHTLAAAGTALVRPQHVISGRSAAIVRGLPTLAVPDQPEVTAGPGPLGPRERTHVFGAALTKAETSDWHGTMVTTVARTLADLGRHDRRDAIMAADAALHEQLVTVAEIERAVAAAAGWPGVRQAREVLALASPEAESPLESLTRLALHDDGFPAPNLQVEIDDVRRGRRYRVDLLFPEARLILEVDGRVKYGADAYSTDERWAEKKRETRLRALGYRVERILWSDVMQYWPETSARLRRLLCLPVA